MSDERINAHCSICGKGYYKCNSCAEMKNITPWRSIVDSIEHYKIFIILRDYTNKYVDIKETKNLLEKCDLSEYKTFDKDVVKVIDEILSYKEEVKEQKVIKRNKRNYTEDSEEESKYVE